MLEKKIGTQNFKKLMQTLSLCILWSEQNRKTQSEEKRESGREWNGNELLCVYWFEEKLRWHSQIHQNRDRLNFNCKMKNHSVRLCISRELKQVEIKSVCGAVTKSRTHTLWLSQWIIIWARSAIINHCYSSTVVVSPHKICNRWNVGTLVHCTATFAHAHNHLFWFEWEIPNLKAFDCSLWLLHAFILIYTKNHQHNELLIGIGCSNKISNACFLSNNFT